MAFSRVCSEASHPKEQEHGSYMFQMIIKSLTTDYDVIQVCSSMLWGWKTWSINLLNVAGGSWNPNSKSRIEKKPKGEARLFFPQVSGMRVMYSTSSSQSRISQHMAEGRPQLSIC